MRVPFFALMTGLALSGQSCILTMGCSQQAVDRAFGYTESGIEFDYYAGIFGASGKAKISSKLNGDWELEVDPVTQKITKLSGQLNSDPEPIYDAQGRRIHENFLAGRTTEWNGMIQQQRIATDALVTVAVKAIDTLGPGFVQSFVSNGLKAGLDPGLLASLLDSLVQAQALIPKVTTPTP